MNTLRHLAVILDGNGRWAKSKGLPRNAGHIQGAKVVEEMCELVWKYNIEYFTVMLSRRRTGQDLKKKFRH